MATIGNRIKELRLRENLTGEEFGSIFSRSKIWTHTIENGRTSLSLEQLIVLKNHFKVSYDWLLEGQSTGGEHSALVNEVSDLCKANRDLLTFLKGSNQSCQ